jgi:O-succinylbenzoate synthase
LDRFFAPALLATPALDTASAVREVLQPFGGNRMAKAAVECACWDLEAKQAGLPLWKLIGGSADPVPCGVALGLQSGVGALLDRIEDEVADNYRRIKLKIGRGWDVEVLEAVRKRFPQIVLMVDANGAYSAADIELLASFDAFDLLMIEQPFRPDDLSACKAARDRIRTPICLDESVTSVGMARAVLDYDLCDIVNIKVGRVGGHVESAEIAQVCREANIPTWCGAQHEAGLGRAHNLATASLLPREIPSELSASARYWDEDIVDPALSVDKNGFMSLPSAPGVGFDLNFDLIEACTVRRLEHGRP